jgi:sugar (pentulose or hexulose) kinase
MGDDWLFISSGTWSLIGTETEKPVINETAYKYNLSNSGMPLRTNMFKKNIQGMWVIQQCRQVWGDQYSYEQIVQMAAQVTDNRYYIDVDQEAFYAPKNMPKAIAEAVKRDFGVEIDWKDIPRISRICFESLALKYRYYSDKLLDAADKKVSKVYILGGGSYNQLVNQFTANATGYPVYTGVYEGSNIANILLQAYGCGEIKDKQEMRRIVCGTFETTKYMPEDTQLWNEKYDVFEKKISHKAQW